MTSAPAPGIPSDEAAGHEADGHEADEALVARVRAGEVQLFELVVRRYNRRLFRVARAVLRDDVESEDVVQESWVRAFAHLGEFEGRARFSTWVTRICVHEALARARRAHRFVALEAPPSPEGEHVVSSVARADAQKEESMPIRTPEQHASDGELRRVLEDAIDELPDPFRAVFMMRSVEQMSVAETAECLGIPEDTVKTRAFRARALLQQGITDRLDSAAQDAFSFAGARCDRIVAAVLHRIGAGAPAHPEGGTSSGESAVDGAAPVSEERR